MHYLTLKLINKETASISKIVDVTRKQLQHLMVIVIEVIRQDVSKYIDSGETRNSQESKLIKTLNNALTIAKWMDKIGQNNSYEDNDFEIPTDLQMFESIKIKLFDAIKSKN